MYRNGFRTKKKASCLRPCAGYYRPVPLQKPGRSHSGFGVPGQCSGSAFGRFAADTGVWALRQLTVALAGNPNVGKSTLFNALTGQHQHTGNWPGKTVGAACGRLCYKDAEIMLVDLPGTYTLEGTTEDERIAGEYICSNQADCTVVVCDAGCLERSLILPLQILQQCHNVVLCVNLIDEANRRGIRIDRESLADRLSVPIVFTSAGREEGLDLLLQTIYETADDASRRPLSRWDDEIDGAYDIARACVTRTGEEKEKFRRKVDRLLVSRRFGVPFLILILLMIIWLTVWGANYPGGLLECMFDWGYGMLGRLLFYCPGWLQGILLDGIYATCSRVISVMLPPMAIFFPVFTVLEDVGYLPRMAFLLDPWMARCGGCGKQALTLCMGLGCNAVGVTGCRIIDSPRERVCAIVTNALVPCNGRFPTLILLGTLFFSGAGAALTVAACVALGVVGATVVSGVLSRTVYRSAQSTFVMELPPFRRPRLGQILIRSLADRTLRITARALWVAAPAGALLWLCANTSVLGHVATLLDPVGEFLGMNGIILLGFLFCFPANELLIPVILMVLTGNVSLGGNIGTDILQSAFTWEMAVCTMVFTLFHWPCATTLMTIYRETRDIKTTAAAFVLPTAVGCLICMLLRLIL